MGKTIMPWDGNGHQATFTLTDDEVLSLLRAGSISIDDQSPDLVAAMTTWRKLQQRAEDILNEQRAARR